MLFSSKMLSVDLSSGEIAREDLPEAAIGKFLSGRGINAWLLAQHLDADSDPLAPESILAFSSGLLTGTAAASSSRLHVNAISPLTGLLGSSNVGGYFGPELRAAGVQTLVVSGRAPGPVTLNIDGERVEIRDATHLWGLDTRSATQTLQEELGKKSRLMVIGPGGENGVRYACILTGTRHAAGRTGMGAVMGSKNLKAIAVRGERQRLEHDEATSALLRDYVGKVRASPRYETWARFSNTALVTWADEAGLLATRNYRRVRFEGAERIDGKRLFEHVTRPRSCHRCPVHCKAGIDIREGRYAGTRGERPDLEPIINLGSKCGVDDPEALLYLYNLAGDLGIDAISTAGALAFAMDLYDRGILSTEDTDGVELTWGNAEAMAVMMRSIAVREGFGAVLAEGVRRAAELIGGGAKAYAYHSKGLELTGYDPRGGMGTALGYAVSTRGGDFTSVYAVPEYRWGAEEGREWFGSEKSVDRLSVEGKGELVKRSMVVSATLDALGLCKVPVLSIVCDYSLQDEAALTSALTGLEVSAGELSQAGERIVNAERLINLHLGADMSDDDLPDHFVEDRVPDAGPTHGMTVDIEQLRRDFYRAMAWDEQGAPTREKLRELELESFISEGRVPHVGDATASARKPEQ
jgi:aldehyde:ferredoxin oxidoreductase